MKIANYKYLGSLSVALILALTTGCGEGTNGQSAKQQELYSLDTRGVTTAAPSNPAVDSIDYKSADVSFDFPLNNDNPGFDGFYVHVIPLPYGTTSLPTVEEWIDLDPVFAGIAKKGITFKEYNATSGFYRHHVVVPNLEENTTYAFIPSAYLDYDVAGNVAKRDLLANSYVIATTAVAPLPDPCLTVRGWMNNTNETFRERWADYIFGAHPMWCFAKDMEGKPVFDGVRVYRSEKDPVTGLFGTPVELAPKDGVFDFERDYMDCPLEENHTYRYILQAFTLDVDGVTKHYHDKNVTEDITMDSSIPTFECDYCK